jgi:hypothetical protein
VNEILERLKSIRKENHPDRTQGVFENDDVKEAYVNANNAIEYVAPSITRPATEPRHSCLCGKSVSAKLADPNSIYV